MDPAACLRLAADQISDDPIAAQNTLREYRQWRARGGYEPIVWMDRNKPDEAGDSLATRLQTLAVIKWNALRLGYRNA
jgi:hypothetical protein